MSPEDTSQAKQQQRIPGCGDRESEVAGLSKTAKRNIKRKEKRKLQQGQDGNVDVESVIDAVENVAITEGGDNKKPLCNTASPHAGASDDPITAATEKAKKIKNLKKKLRQIEELQQKMDSGEIKQPSKEQLEKIGRAIALRDELQQLEEDS